MYINKIKIPGNFITQKKKEMADFFSLSVLRVVKYKIENIFLVLWEMGREREIERERLWASRLKTELKT